MTDISQLVGTAHTEKHLLRAAHIADAVVSYTSRNMRRELEELYADGLIPGNYDPIDPTHKTVVPGSSYAHRH